MLIGNDAFQYPFIAIVISFTYRQRTDTIFPAPLTKALARRGLHWYSWSSILYNAVHYSKWRLSGALGGAKCGVSVNRFYFETTTIKKSFWWRIEKCILSSSHTIKRHCFLWHWPFNLLTSFTPPLHTHRIFKLLTPSQSNRFDPSVSPLLHAWLEPCNIQPFPN